MLFGYEFKKVCRRVSPLLLLICVVGVATVTLLISGLVLNHAPTPPVDVSAEYSALASKIADWDNNRQVAIKNAFDDFYTAYKRLNADTPIVTDAVLVNEYKTAGEKFKHFYSDYYHQFIYTDENNKVADYLLLKANTVTELNATLLRLHKFFVPELSTAKAIRDGLEVNAEVEATMFTTLDNLQIQILADNDLVALQDFFTAYPAGVPEQDYTVAYAYALNRYWVSVDQNTPHDQALNTYDGFETYHDQNTSTQTALTAEYRLNHPNKDFAQPFTFGKIYNNRTKVSLLDFVFTNLEMAAIPLLLLVIIIATAAFFTDTYQNTIVTTVAATRNRALVIITKAVVVLLLAVIGLLLFTAIYLIGGWLFFQGTITADILFLFNGTTPTVMSAINYFVLYLLSLLFKMLPFIALTGILSFAKTKPFVIVGSAFAIVVAVILGNSLLGYFAFYRFFPWQALDFMRYFGATLFISPTPVGSNLWYTLPVMSLITIYLYWQLVHNFRRRDF